MSACTHYPGQQRCRECGLGMPRCSRCNDWLFDDIEIDTGICASCGTTLYEREQRRREWDYYHPDDPAPACELEPR